MLTNEERCEIVEEIREAAQRDFLGFPCFTSITLERLFNLEVKGAILGVNFYTRESAMRMADLIEPEPERTCEILHDDNLSEQYGGPMARCSYCRAVLPEEFTGPYYYCPCCGSKNKVVCDAN